MNRTINIFYFLVVIVFLSCKYDIKQEKHYDVRSDIRLNDKFYSIFLNQDGYAYVVKGIGTNYTELLEVKKSDTSNIFKLDSALLFYNKLKQFKRYPIIGEKRLGAPRAEIYFENIKVYDTYRWDSTFWDFFRPIMEQIPQGYNPFLTDDNPFH